jgi:hypothetical protein
MAPRYFRPSISPGGYSLRGWPCISVPACSRWKTLRQLRGNLAASPNRIAFAWALRGTIATGLPLVALPALGLGPLSNFVVIGALNTSMVDVGGSYRSRLIPIPDEENPSLANPASSTLEPPGPLRPGRFRSLRLGITDRPAERALNRPSLSGQARHGFALRDRRRVPLAGHASDLGA